LQKAVEKTHILNIKTPNYVIMPKKRKFKLKSASKVNSNGLKVERFTERRTKGEKLADGLAKFAGSWTFIVGLLSVLVIWMFLNVAAWSFHWDVYPYILLNFVLSCIAALFGPIILISQNREAEVSKKKAEYDYKVNRKAEREITQIQKDVDKIKNMISGIKRKR